MNEVKGYVNAQAMLEMLEQYKGCYFPHSAAVHIVNKLVQTDVAPVTRAYWDLGVCTGCGFDIRCIIDGESYFEDWVWNEGFDYCPNCSAKMGKEAEQND